MHPAEVLNTALALAACGDDAALAQKMLKRYRALLPSEQAILERAYAEQDLEMLHTRAHRLRAGSRFMGAERMASALQRLEDVILKGAPQEVITSAWMALNQEFQALLEPPEEVLLALFASARQ